jgi:modification methylase
MSDHALLPAWAGNQIICGDALEVMRRLPDGCVDLVVTSPPYNIHSVKGYGTSSWRHPKLENGYDGYADNLPPEEYVAWQRACLTEMLRLIPEDGAVFYNHKWRIRQLRLHVKGFPLRQIIIWKRQGFVFNRAFFVPRYEVVYLIAKRGFKLAPKASGLGDVWAISQRLGNPHPAPFPLELPARIIGATAAQVVLDPFMGSGTTALAARNLGRTFVGIEQSRLYCQMAEERLATAAEAAA